MKPERINELRRSNERASWQTVVNELSDCLDEVERFQTVMRETAENLRSGRVHRHCCQHFTCGGECNRCDKKNVNYPGSTVWQDEAQGMADRLEAAAGVAAGDDSYTSTKRVEKQPENVHEKCNATWRYPDNGRDAGSRGSVYRCGLDAGHDGRHFENGRAAWGDKNETGVTPHRAAAKPPEAPVWGKSIMELVAPLQLENLRLTKERDEARGQSKIRGDECSRYEMQIALAWGATGAPDGTYEQRSLSEVVAEIVAGRDTAERGRIEAIADAVKWRHCYEAAIKQDAAIEAETEQLRAALKEVSAAHDRRADLLEMNDAHKCGVPCPSSCHVWMNERGRLNRRIAHLLEIHSVGR